MPGPKTEQELLEAILAHNTVLTALVTTLLATHPERTLLFMRADGPKFMLEEKFEEHFERHRTRYLYSDQSERFGQLLEMARAKAIEDIRAACIPDGLLQAAEKDKRAKG